MPAPVMQILYGPPGTGKTWQATRRAVRVIDPHIPDDQVIERHNEMVLSGQIIWVTFHPSFTYEDFIEGFRPEATEKGIMYSPRPGPFRLACNNVTLSPPAGQVFFVGQRLTSSTGNEYDVVTAASDSVVVRNAKGKGAGLLTPVSLHVIERLKNIGYAPGDLSLPGTEHDKKSAIAKRAGFDMQTLFGMTGPLRAVWEFAESTTPTTTVRRPVILVIDEINRADLSRVFGDVITLLEPDKRLKGREEKRLLLPYSQVYFGVPEELNIIGMMNTADSSLSVMDLALRRRFEFVEVPPEPARCAAPYGGVNLPNILRGWNRAVSALATREKQIGHAYLERFKLDDIRIRSGFEADEDGELRVLAAVTRQEILPLMLEVLRGDWQKVNFVFGRNFDSESGGLLNPVDDAALRTRAGDQIDIGATADFYLPDWWDPRSDNWRAERFSDALNAAALPA